jgi:hypothetical protein
LLVKIGYFLVKVEGFGWNWSKKNIFSFRPFFKT